MVIEAPDLAWAQRMMRQRGIVIDSIDPAPPREPAAPIKLNRRGPGGSTLGGRAVAVLTAEAPRPAPPSPSPFPPAPAPQPASIASWVLWTAVAAAAFVLGLIVWLVL